MILHVVIPTYNRADKLEKTLDSIKSLLVNHYVSVFDNASTDGTNVVCTSFAANYVGFNYERRPINIGGNGNIMASVVSSVIKGDMLWILADDDVVDSTGLLKLIEFLDGGVEEAPDALVVGACTTRGESFVWPPTTDFCNVKSSEFWMHASFLPTLIHKTSSLRESIKPDLFYVGGCYSQLLLYRNLLEAKAVVRVLSTRVIYRGDGDNAHSQPAWWLVSWHRAIRCFPREYHCCLFTALGGSIWVLPLRFIFSLKRRTSGTSPLYEVGYLDLAACYPLRHKLFFWFYSPFLLFPKSFFALISLLRSSNNGQCRSDLRE